MTYEDGRTATVRADVTIREVAGARLQEVR